MARKPKVTKVDAEAPAVEAAPPVILQFLNGLTPVAGAPQLGFPLHALEGRSGAQLLMPAVQLVPTERDSLTGMDLLTPDGRFSLELTVPVPLEPGRIVEIAPRSLLFRKV